MNISKNLISTIGLLCSLFICMIYFQQCKAIALESAGSDASNRRDYVTATKLFHEAAVAAPWELHYQQKELAALWDLFPILSVDQDNNFVGLSMTTAKEMVMWHPNDPTSHDYAARALKTLSMFGIADTLLASQREMQIANQLAPTFVDYSDSLRNIDNQLEQRKRNTL